MTSAGGWRRRSKQRQYRAVWVEGHDLVAQGILLSGRMMAGAHPPWCCRERRLGLDGC